MSETARREMSSSVQYSSHDDDSDGVWRCVEKFNTYVTLRLKNASASTIAIKNSSSPCWHQDFLLWVYL